MRTSKEQDGDSRGRRVVGGSTLDTRTTPLTGGKVTPWFSRISLRSRSHLQRCNARDQRHSLRSFNPNRPKLTKECSASLVASSTKQSTTSVPFLPSRRVLLSLCLSTKKHHSKNNRTKPLIFPTLVTYQAPSLSNLHPLKIVTDPPRNSKASEIFSPCVFFRLSACQQTTT